ncbi:MAG: hypothetical protein UY95_C0010G0012 [Parcubacteria group bacterium GW2011_GWA2_56_7]|nr:MAG: hypothetical protein UY95_C0010G0012 [Parcubacteria group bacterium GW2011_GWA2_56_7]
MQHVSKWVERTSFGLLLALVFLLPVFFLPTSLDVLETNKQALLVILVACAALAFVGNVLIKKQLTWARGWYNVLPVLLLLSAMISAFVSLGSVVSWLGGSGQEYQSILTTLALTGLFFLVINLVRTDGQERLLFSLFLLSASLVLFSTVLQSFGVFAFPWEFLQARAFNTVGTVNALGLFGIVASVFGTGLWLVSGREEREVFLAGRWGSCERGLIVWVVLSTLFLLLAIDFWVLWTVLLTGSLCLFVFGIARAQEFPHTNRFLLPMLMVVVALLFLVLQRPYNLALPVEVTPTFSASVSIAGETLNAHSWWFGSGPGTYAYDYAAFRPLDVNATSFWNVRFDRGHSYLLTLLSTNGVVGVGAWLLLVLVLFFGSLRILVTEKRHVVWKMHVVLFSTWLTLIVSAFLYSWNMTLQTLFYLFTALMALQLFHHRSDIRLARSPRMGLLLSFLFVLFSIGIVTVCFLVIQRHVADVSFARAIRADRAGAPMDEVLSALDRAATQNRYQDVYYRNLAEGLLHKIREEIGPGTEALTPERAAFVQALTAGSVNAAKRATDLAPYQVQNWRTRGDVYRELMPILSDAYTFGVVSYERAVALEPNNPLNHVGLARVYLLDANLKAQLLQSDNVTVREEATRTRLNALTKAETSLARAIELKPDYALAHYYLALVFDQAGKTHEALSKLEAVRAYNPLDVGVAFQIGLLAMRTDQLDYAKQEFERAVTLLPTYANARWFLASVYEAEGNVAQAIQELQILSDLLPDEPLISARLKRLLEGETKKALPEPLDLSGQPALGADTGVVVEEESPSR